MVSHFLQMCQAGATEKKDKTIKVHLSLNGYFFCFVFHGGENNAPGSSLLFANIISIGCWAQTQIIAGIPQIIFSIIVAAVLCLIGLFGI